MGIAQGMLAEFDHEARTTRKFIERVPADKLDWKPHPKSRTAGQLALHIASSPGLVIDMANQNSAPAPDSAGGGPQPKDMKEIIAAFEASIAQVHKVLPTLDDERMREKWTVTDKKGNALMSIPRVAFLRGILLNHIFHHRGQLGVYLRLLGAPVPAAYGPSADEVR